MHCRSLLLTSLLFAAGCTGYTDGYPDDVGNRSTYGKLQVQLQTAGKAEGTREKVVVSLVKITAHSNTAGWVTLSTERQTVDLLQLSSKILGEASLPAGKISQIRLYTEEGAPNYVELKNGQRFPLKVPSGVQSGIKVKGLFEVGHCQNMIASLLYDGNKSIHVHPTGHGDEYILRPVIRLAKTHATDVQCPGTNTGTPGNPGSGTPGTGSGDPNDGFNDGSPTDPNDPNGSTGDPSDPSDPNGTPGSTTPGDPNGTPGTSTPTDDFQDGAGSPCATGATCLSGLCSAGVCSSSGPGGACVVSGDCGSGSACTADGVCGVTPTSGGTGSACTQNQQCLSGTCSAGVCDPGSTGNSCTQSGDCASGFTCQAGSCQPLIN